MASVRDVTSVVVLLDIELTNMCLGGGGMRELMCVCVCVLMTHVSVGCLLHAGTDDEKYAWTRHVKGMISLGGVLFGTEAADTIFYSGHVNQQLTALLTSTVEMVDYSQVTCARSASRDGVGC